MHTYRVVTLVLGSMSTSTPSDCVIDSANENGIRGAPDDEEAMEDDTFDGSRYDEVEVIVLG